MITPRFGFPWHRKPIGTLNDFVGYDSLEFSRGFHGDVTWCKVWGYHKIEVPLNHHKSSISRWDASFINQPAIHHQKFRTLPVANYLDSGLSWTCEQGAALGLGHGPVEAGLGSKEMTVLHLISKIMDVMSPCPDRYSLRWFADPFQWSPPGVENLDTSKHMFFIAGHPQTPRASSQRIQMSAADSMLPRTGKSKLWFCGHSRKTWVWMDLDVWELWNT